MQEEQTQNIKELLTSDNPTDLFKAEELLNSGKYNTETGDLIKEPEQSGINQEPEQSEINQNKEIPKYEIEDYHGNKKLIEDPDGFFGRKNLETLKKSYIDSQKFQQTLLREKRSERAEKLRIKAEKDDLEKRLKEFEEKINNNIQEKKEQPGFGIKKPTLPDDPAEWTDEQSMEFAAWRDSISDYATTIDSTSRKLESKYENIEKTLQDYQKEIELLRSEREKKEFENVNNGYWKDVDNIAKKYDEFKIPENKSIKDIHEEILRWTEDAATSSGIMQEGYDETSQKIYAEQRDEIIQRYLDGDITIKEQLKNVPPPEGYEQYFKMVELNRKRQELINSKELGQNASLESTLALLKYKDGSLDKTMNNIQTQSMIQGQQNVFNAMKETSEKYASTLPNDSRIQQDNRNSESRIKEVLSMDYGIIESDPKLKNEYESYLEKLSLGGFSI